MVVICIFALLAISNWVDVTYNYRLNEQIYYENIARIEEFKENKQQEKQIILVEPYDYKYGFNKFVGIDWIETDVKKFFDIDLGIELVEEKIK